YFDTGQTRKAVSAYERSLTLAPDNADVLTDLGTMYRELGDYERAITSFRRASTVNPSHENALFNEGVVLYFDLHRKDEAQKAWQRLLRLNPDARAPDGRSVADILGTLR
ncbi:MAG: tetratricopeptide repeat protein, partial [Desulfovibrio sp.]|nr:tetratricopeptide repeat protein [Desulfovibrio sp.]